MKKTALLFFLVLGFSINSKAQTWAQLPDFPGAERDDGVAFAINNKAYCGSGLQVGWSLTGDFHCLDLGTETWSTVASMPAGEERQYACGFTNGTNGFVFGGEAGGTDLNDLWMYSPTTNSWTAKASKPGNGVRGASCFVIGDTAYIVGGATGTVNAISEVWGYIFSLDSWIQKNNAPFTIWRASGANYGGGGAILFGRDVNGSFRRELYYYQPTADWWQLGSLFPGNGRAYSTIQTLSNTSLNLFVYCGYDSLNNYYNDAYSYYGPANLWFPLNSIPSFGRKGGMGFTWMTNTYYTCGINQSNTRLKETWKADQYVGIREFEKNPDMTIYPNPALDKIYLKFSKPNLYDYTISDISGRILLSGTLQNNYQIDVSSLNQGVYFLVAGGYNSKLIIQ